MRRVIAKFDQSTPAADGAEADEDDADGAGVGPSSRNSETDLNALRQRVQDAAEKRRAGAYTPDTASRALPQPKGLPAPGAFSEGGSTSRRNSEGSSSDLVALRHRVQDAAEKRRAGAYTPDAASRQLPQPKGLPAPGAFTPASREPPV